MMKRMFVFVFALLMGWGNMAFSTERSDGLMENGTFAGLSEGVGLWMNADIVTDQNGVATEGENTRFSENARIIAGVDLQCKVTVSGEVNVGVFSFTIEVEISGDCSAVMKSGKQIANMILQEVKNELRSKFN